MSRVRNAAVSSALQGANLVVAIVSGFVLFPLVVRAVGPHDYGLWLATGETVGYLMLTDLGVMAVLPWLVAARDGAGDADAVARYLADAVAVGVAVGAVAGAGAAVVWWADPTRLGVNPADWSLVRGPLTVLLGLTAAGLPLRAFTGLLQGLQDVTFVGLVAVTQSVLAVGLTAATVVAGYGLTGLAVAAGLPPVVAGGAAAVRALVRFRSQTAGWYRPTAGGCGRLVREGFGVWLGQFGVRLQTASGGLVCAALGRPDWATVLATTGKVAQVAQPLCTLAGDSGLVGLSHLAAGGDVARTRRAVVCLLLLYLIPVGGVAVGLAALNGWFVGVWLDPGLYAGGHTNAVLAAGAVAWVAAGGLFKTVGAVGRRSAAGLITVGCGALMVGVSYLLGAGRGLAGVAEGGLIVATAGMFPAGIALVAAVHGIAARELITGTVLPWAVRAVPVFVLAAAAGHSLSDRPAVLLPTAAALGVAYLVAVRPLLDRAPWPPQVRRWLARVRLVRPQPYAD